MRVPVASFFKCWLGVLEDSLSSSDTDGGLLGVGCIGAMKPSNSDVGSGSP
jgi:hypothetical protein